MQKYAKDKKCQNLNVMQKGDNRSLLNATSNWMNWFCTQLITPNRNVEENFHQFLAAIVCWNTWKMRCEVTFQNANPSLDHVIRRCINDMWDYHHSFTLPNSTAQRFFQLNSRISRDI
jgi:hypothetical protein